MTDITKIITEMRIECESDIEDLKKLLLEELSTDGIRTEVTVWRIDT